MLLMKDTKTIRVVLNKDEKDLIKTNAKNNGFENISNYARQKIITDLIKTNNIKNLFRKIKNGTNS